MKKLLIILNVFVLPLFLTAQSGSIYGKITSDGVPLAFVNVQIKDSNTGTTSDADGYYSIENLALGEATLIISYLGYETEKRSIMIDDEFTNKELNIALRPSEFVLDDIVVTGTKTFKRQTQSPIIVNILSSSTLENVQACNLSDGLKFQPGLRVEVDCQTCNYTQLRMNGLGGGYSQILINGRPIFSPLTGLYGMEQIPTNMIERIEIVRGGGSALYGTSAVGGTVNVITKIPQKSTYDIGYTYQNVNGQAADRMLIGNATYVSKNGNFGASFFLNNRDREWYDHNGDNFSELPSLQNNSFGTNLFFQPRDNQKLELSLTKLNEYRYGGEMVNRPAHLASQSEERTHDVWLGSLDYQVNFDGDNASFISYLAAQRTDRDHFTGIAPDVGLELEDYLLNPPYGVSLNTTFQGGAQLNRRLNNFLGGSTIFTVGAEFVLDDIFDEITAYNYQVDQVTRNYGLFLQNDWEINSSLSLLTGIRADKHNFVDRTIFSPRVSLLYRLKNTTQFRLTWGTGFRAPQAFDADLHIAFAGGGISRISLSPKLEEERSNSISGSINFDKVSEQFVAGFTLEGFYTHLNNAFYLHPLGEDAFGERFEKRNGDGATVQGATLELRVNYQQKAQIEAGFTVQSSLFDEPVENIEGLPAFREFLRTPNNYGYATLTFFPNKRFNTSVNIVYTGSMRVAHFAGAEGVEFDEYVDTQNFTELSFKTGYTFPLKRINSGLEIFGGIKNITNAYQNDFDIGKNRDSNFVYGPANPRTFFVGLRMSTQ